MNSEDANGPDKGTLVNGHKGFSVKDSVVDQLRKNPLLTARPLCRILGLPYEKYANYVTYIRSCWNKEQRFRLTPYTPKILPHRRVFVWDGLERSKEAQNKAFGHGWVRSRNRNGALLFKDSRGSVQWHSNGHVVLYVQGPANLGRAKELFCRAFSWFSDRELDRLTSGVLHESSRHWVFRIGEPLPRFDIRAFVRSHGLEAVSDGSHPLCIEFIESEPLYLQRYDRLMVQLAQNIQAHLNLIREWQKEARSARTRRSARAKKARKDCK